MPRKPSKSIARTTKGKGRHYLPASQGAGMTAAGRRAYNAKNKANLKPPVTGKKPSKADAARRKSFCARMGGVVKKAKGPATRARASMKRWKC